MAQARFFGTPHRRIEDRRFLLGQGGYLEDLHLVGELQAAFVRSSHGHARIAAMDLSSARSIPGVVAALGPADVGRNPHIPVVIPQEDLRSCQQQALAEGSVRYVGEPIAIVIAEDRYVAEDAAARALAGLEFEPLPALVDAERALEDGAPVLHSSCPDNLAANFRFSVGAADAAFQAAELVVGGRFEVQRYTGLPIEPRGVLSSYAP